MKVVFHLQPYDVVWQTDSYQADEHLKCYLTSFSADGVASAIYLFNLKPQCRVSYNPTEHY